MENGFLAIETHCERPGKVRLFVSDLAPTPDTNDSERRLRYAAQCSDRDAALMHTHELIKRRLVDPDTHIYRVSLARAIAAAESIDLRHRRVYLDPDLDDTTNTQIAEHSAYFIRLQRRKTKFFEIMGYMGIGLLLLNIFVLSLV